MNELFFKSIAIVNKNTGVAKYQEFKEGINVVTSPSSDEGNWVGKSSLLQSLYHTLGADALFKKPWEDEGNYIYILDFVYNEKNYLMVRYEHLFQLYDSNSNELFSVNHRSDLSKELTKIFNIRMKLKDRSAEKKYVDADPAFWYLLNYYDQMRPEVCHLDSFDGLTKFSDFYTDVIYSHLGIKNDALNGVVEEIEQLNRQKDGHIEKKEKYEIVYDELNSRKVPVVDEKAIRVSLEKFENEYKQIIAQLNESHSKLEDYYKTKAELEALIEDIDKMISKQKGDIKTSEEQHICPHCGSELTDGRDYYFRRVKDIDGFGLQRLEIDRELAQCRHQIEEELSRYNSITSVLKELKQKIEDSQSGNKGDLVGIALSDTLQDILTKIGEEETSINSCDEQIKEKNKAKRELLKAKADVDSCYISNLIGILSKYPLQNFKVDYIQTADDKIKAPGTVNNIAKVIWLSALLRTRTAKNVGYPVFPVVFDNPNNADYDETNEKKIFSITFDLSDVSKQVITSLVGFDKEQYSDYEDINVIVLDNEQYHLLTKQDYEVVKEKYKTLPFFVD